MKVSPAGVPASVTKLIGQAESSESQFAVGNSLPSFMASRLPIISTMPLPPPRLPINDLAATTGVSPKVFLMAVASSASHRIVPKP